MMWQFSEAIDGIAEACRALEIPITGGNVSFYNETLGKPIYPTPILGVLGLLEDAECALGSGFRQRRRRDSAAGRIAAKTRSNPDADYNRTEFSSSEYAKTIHGIVAGAPPAIDLAAEKQLDRMPGEARERESNSLRARRKRWRPGRDACGILLQQRRLVGARCGLAF